MASLDSFNSVSFLSDYHSANAELVAFDPLIAFFLVSFGERKPDLGIAFLTHSVSPTSKLSSMVQ